MVRQGYRRYRRKTLEIAYQIVLEHHPGARVSTIDMEVSDPRWMRTLMHNCLQDWEDDFIP